MQQINKKLNKNRKPKQLHLMQKNVTRPTHMPKNIYAIFDTVS